MRNAVPGKAGRIRLSVACGKASNTLDRCCRVETGDSSTRGAFATYAHHVPLPIFRLSTSNSCVIARKNALRACQFHSISRGQMSSSDFRGGERHRPAGKGCSSSRKNHLLHRSSNATLTIPEWRRKVSTNDAAGLSGVFFRPSSPT
jgi:hypothetical protein